MKKAPPKKVSKVGERVVTCLLCSDTFYSHKDLVDHYLDKHSHKPA